MKTIRGQFKNKRDANEPAIFAILRGYGIQVCSTDQPLDSICAFKGVNYLVEVKNGLKAPLTKPQAKFLKDWRGQYVILHNESEAHEWASAVVSAKSQTV